MSALQETIKPPRLSTALIRRPMSVEIGRRRNNDNSIITSYSGSNNTSLLDEPSKLRLQQHQNAHYISNEGSDDLDLDLLSMDEDDIQESPKPAMSVDVPKTSGVQKPVPAPSPIVRSLQPHISPVQASNVESNDTIRRQQGAA